MTIEATARPRHTDADEDDDEALDNAAQGYNATAEEPDSDSAVTSEVEAIGEAAGVPERDGERFRSTADKVARRDAQRWELDPDSAEDAADKLTCRR